MKTLLLLVAQLAASGSDAYLTDRNQHMAWHYEANPLVRPFVKSRGNLIAFFSVSAGLKLYAPLKLRKRHSKISTIIAVTSIADNTEAAIYSAVH